MYLEHFNNYYSIIRIFAKRNMNNPEFSSINANLAAVIMAGGAGTRFWPVSTTKKPKQFLNIFSERTLLQQSFDRIKDIIPAERIFVLTNAVFTDLVKEQLPEIPAGQIIGEPFRRDTAAAAALAAVLIKKLYGSSCVIVTLTADHKIDPYDKFQETILSAAEAAQSSEALYTLGIVPTYPATSYGYLECGEKIAIKKQMFSREHYKLLRFKEKPDIETARHFLAEGNYYWNSGMFIWNAAAVYKEYAKQQPKHIEAMEKAVKQFGAEGWRQALSEAFEPLPRLSLDYAIMEHAEDVRMLKSDFEWLDMGGWIAAAPFLEGHDDEGNSFKAEHLYAYQSHGNIIFTDDPQHTIALIGVKDMAVIHSQGKTLIVPIARLDEVKKLTDLLPEDLR